MEFSKLLFNKTLYQLEFTDIMNYFLIRREESLNLEFKSFAPQGDYTKKEEAIKKAVCGLLNSEGGIIIWGAPVEVKDEKGNTMATGNLTPFDSNLDKDRLVNILTSSITPMPIGIKVQVLKDGNNHSIFIIEVQKSIERPHQFDNRYYVRLDGQTRIAPHYLISALMKSSNYPVIRGHIKLKHITNDGNNAVLRFRKLLYNTSDFNNDKHVYFKIVAAPGNIMIGNQSYGGIFENTFPLLSKGAPLVGDFTLIIPIAALGQEITILLNFGGEKSPSKTSIYKYIISVDHIVAGDVPDEAPYLQAKDENRLPSDVTDNTADQNIELIMNA